MPFYPGERIEAKILCNATTQLFRSLYLDLEESIKHLLLRPKILEPWVPTESPVTRILALEIFLVLLLKSYMFSSPIN